MNSSPRLLFADTVYAKYDEPFPACTSKPNDDDHACCKENTSSVINSNSCDHTSSSLGGMARSTLASTVSGQSNPFSPSEKPPL